MFFEDDGFLKFCLNFLRPLASSIFLFISLGFSVFLILFIRFVQNIILVDSRYSIWYYAFSKKKVFYSFSSYKSFDVFPVRKVVKDNGDS